MYVHTYVQVYVHAYIRRLPLSTVVFNSRDSKKHIHGNTTLQLSLFEKLAINLLVQREVFRKSI